MQQISDRNSDVPFASILCCLTTRHFSFVKGLIFQPKPYRMTRLIQTMQLFVRCELSTFKTTFCRIGSSFWIPYSLNFVSWERSNEIEQTWWLRLMLLCTLDQLPSGQLSGEVFKRTAQRLQCWICSFSLRLYRWGRCEHLVSKNQDIWPCGYHPPSGFLCSFHQFPSFLRWSTCLIWSTKAFPLCDGATPNPTWCHKQPLSICNVELLLFGEEKGEKGAAPLTLQSGCEGGKTRVLIGLQVSDRQNSICKRRSFGLRYRYS